MSTDLATASRLAQALANTTKTPVSVVAEAERYRIRDDADLACYGGRSAIVATYQPVAGEPPPGFPDDDDGTEDGGGPPARALAHLIDLQTQRRCLNCAGNHKTWACPEIARALFAPEPWADPDLGRELCRMMWRRYPAFVTLLREVHGAGHLETYARSYQAFIRANRPDSDLTIPHVLDAWSRVISGEREPMIREAA